MSAKTGADDGNRAIRIDKGGDNPEFAVRNDGQVDVGLVDSGSTSSSGVVLKNTSDQQAEVSLQAKSSVSTSEDAFSVYHGSTAKATLDYAGNLNIAGVLTCLLYTSPSPRD